MQNHSRLFQHNSRLDSGQLTRARELLELQSRVQQLFNTLKNVYGDVCQTATAINKVAPRSLFGTGFLESPEPNAQRIARIIG